MKFSMETPSTHSAVHYKSLCVRIVSPSTVVLGFLDWVDGQIKLAFAYWLERKAHPKSLCWASAYLDKHLYLLGGGNYCRISDVSYFHARVPGSCFIECPPMHTRRCKPQTAVVSGKIFVLGDGVGFDWTEPHHWGEVYDPSHKRWDPLNAPWDSLNAREDGLEEMFYSMMTVVLQEEEKILVSISSSRIIYSYDVKNQTWDPYHELENPLQFHGRGYLVDGVIYCSYCGALYAYDMAHRSLSFITFAKILWQTLKTPKDLPSDDDPLLKHMDGNNFCMVWNIGGGELRFVHFQVSISENANQHRYLHTSINCINSFNLCKGEVGAELVDFLTLDGLELDLSKEVDGQHLDLDLWFGGRRVGIDKEFGSGASSDYP